MINGIFIYGLRGEVLASRIYKDGLRRAVTDVFRVQVISNPECNVPILTLGSTSFSYIRHENLYIVAVTRHDVDAALVYELLYKFVELATPLLGVLDESACTTKVHIVYEVLGELIDFGYPQHTELSSLGGLLKQQAKPKAKSKGLSLSRAATGATPWRIDNIRYRQHEVYVDIVESINVVATGDGGISSSTIVGEVQMRTQLSGMPTCTMALSGEEGSMQLEDFQMHQCVNLSEFSASQEIVFVPPDGEFQLMRYRISEDISPPFAITASVNEAGSTHIDYNVQLRGRLPSRTSASDILLRIPVPNSVLRTKFKVSRGKVTHSPGQPYAEWRLGRVSGSQECKLSGSAELTPSGQAWSRPPLVVEFSISMYCSSGIKVRYLKLDEGAGYQPLKWLRYVTKNGTYEVRL